MSKEAAYNLQFIVDYVLPVLTAIVCAGTAYVSYKLLTSKRPIATSSSATTDTELEKAYQDYIELLNEEINELVPLARAHGWKSSRFESGKAARERIKQAKLTPTAP